MAPWTPQPSAPDGDPFDSCFRISSGPRHGSQHFPARLRAGSMVCGCCGSTIAQVSGKSGGYYGCLAATNGRVRTRRSSGARSPRRSSLARCRTNLRCGADRLRPEPRRGGDREAALGPAGDVEAEGSRTDGRAATYRELRRRHRRGPRSRRSPRLWLRPSAAWTRSATR